MCIQVRRGDTLLNTRTGEREVVGQLLAMHGQHATPVEAVAAGSLCAGLGLKGTRTGDTLLRDPKLEMAEARLDGVPIPPPVFHCAVEVGSSAQHKQLDTAVAQVQLEDPSVSLSVDATTGQQLLGGMGELHLQVAVGAEAAAPWAGGCDPNVSVAASLICQRLRP